MLFGSFLIIDLFKLVIEWLNMASLEFDINQKPSDEKEFVKWMEARFGIPNELAESNYNTNAINLLKSFQECPFWVRVGELIKEWDIEYYKEKGVHLMTSINLPEVIYKSYMSLINKVYRKDCLHNDSFPNEPEDGWIDPISWYDKIHDIIRTSFKVKYLDGVKFLVQKLSQVASDVGCDFHCIYEAHDDGYYAAHAAVVIDLSVVDLKWQSISHGIEVEIQITTELQGMIKNLLHKYYEENRKKIIPLDYKWQWDYHNEQFIPNYLGHIAHYLEGMIVEIRDKQK